MVDDLGQEFFTIIRNDGGRAYREAKNAALDLLDDAIRHGHAPGEISSHGG